MGILKSLGFLIILSNIIIGVAFDSYTKAATAKPDPDPLSTAINEAKTHLCLSTTEYIKALKFLRETKDFTFREEPARKIADSVSKGCDGAAERFSTVLLLLKNIGLSERKSIEMALEFASQSPEIQKNFVEIFSNAFLSEFFDFDYKRAMTIAIELSKDYKGDPNVVREDFIRLVRFCKETKALDLPMRLCADYMAKIAKSSQYYQEGVAKPFLELFSNLRERKEFSLDMRTSLSVAHDILKNGPKASQNFFEAFEFGKQNLDYDKRKALTFALNLAARSYSGPNPPLMQFPHLQQEAK